MKLSRHAIDRGHERTGLPLGAFQKLAGRALERGLGHGEVSGKLHRYLTSLYFYNGTGNNIRIYGEHVYVFNGETLITVLHLPNEYKALVKKLKPKP